MPISSGASTSRRLLALLSVLQSRREWPASALSQRLGVSDRTVRRDIERLRELDYAIETVRGPFGGYRLGAGTRLPPLLFDEPQAVAVALALRTAGGLGAGLEEDADRALRTVERLVPPALARRIDQLAVQRVPTGTPGTGAAHADPAVLLEIGAAITAREELRFDHATADGEVPDRPARSLQAHHLLLHDGRWYVVGWSAEHDDWRIFRADRMTLRSPRGPRFAGRTVPGGDAAAFLVGRFRGAASGDQWPCQGSAVVQAPATELAPFVRDGVVEVVDADRCRVRRGSWSWGGLAAALLAFDRDLDDVEPALLREAFRVVARRASVLP